jgi:hypothetical protein
MDWDSASRERSGEEIVVADLDELKLFKDAIPREQFDELRRAFPARHFARLKRERFRFYLTTFWFPLDRPPESVFEHVIRSLLPLADPSPEVIGIEWWFSVCVINATPQWILPCHFDRNDLAEPDVTKLKFPYRSSVLFLNAVPYGELVVTDQRLTDKGLEPMEPRDMRFILPAENLYVTFPGYLYHGVISRMWRPKQPNMLRLAMAVNWWANKPKAAYLRDSRDCTAAFRLDEAASAPSMPMGLQA